MFISKESYRYGEFKNAFLYSVQKPHLPVRDGNYPGSCKLVYVREQKLRKTESTCRHGTVFAPKKCLYQKEATGMESTKMHSSSQLPVRIGKLLRLM